MKVTIDKSFSNNFDWKKELIEKIESCETPERIGGDIVLPADNDNDLVVFIGPNGIYITAPG